MNYSEESITVFARPAGGVTGGVDGRGSCLSMLAPLLCDLINLYTQQRFQQRTAFAIERENLNSSCLSGSTLDRRSEILFVISRRDPAHCKSGMVIQFTAVRAKSTLFSARFASWECIC